MILLTPKKKSLIVAIILLLFAGYYFGSRLSFRWIWPLNILETAKMKELQDHVDTLSSSNAQAKAEIADAKKQAEKALRKAKDARIDIIRYQTQAEAWKGQYEAVAQQRDALAKAVTGEEAIKELRKLGWVR